MEAEKLNKSSKIFLWTVPRCLSTVFSRSLMEINDCKVLVEPHFGSYFFGPDRRAPLYLEKYLDPTLTIEQATNIINQKYEERIVFIKNHASYIENHFDLLFTKEYEGKHTFLIRNPRKTMSSLNRVMLIYGPEGWKLKDPNLKEFNKEAIHDLMAFKRQKELYDFVKANFDANPIVIDADDLMRNPEGIMKAYCHATGIPFDLKILNWEPHKIEIKGLNELIFSDVSTSTGFRRSSEKANVEEPQSYENFGSIAVQDHCREAVSEALPCYLSLYKNRLIAE